MGIHRTIRLMRVPVVLVALSLMFSSAAWAMPGGGEETRAGRTSVFWSVNGGIGMGSYKSVFAGLGLSAEYGHIFGTIRWLGGLSYRYGGLSAAGGRARDIGVLVGYSLRKQKSSISIGAGISSVFSSLHPDIQTFAEIPPFRGVGIPFELRYSWIFSPRAALGLCAFFNANSGNSYGGIVAAFGFGKLR